MTSRQISEMATERPATPASASPESDASANAGRPQTAAPQADAPQDGPQDVPQGVPHVPSPPTSPWWTAPAGKAVEIPAFGRAMIGTLVAMLSPAPRPVPVRVRARR